MLSALRTEAPCKLRACCAGASAERVEPAGLRSAFVDAAPVVFQKRTDAAVIRGFQYIDLEPSGQGFEDASLLQNILGRIAGAFLTYVPYQTVSVVWLQHNAVTDIPAAAAALRASKGDFLSLTDQPEIMHPIHCAPSGSIR